MDPIRGGRGGLGTTTWTYDDLNRVVSVTDPSDQTVGYGYDAVGNRTALVYPDGHTVQYTFDPGNRLTNVRDPEIEVGYNYDAGNHMRGITRTNGVESSYTYTSNKLSSISGENLNVAFQYNGLGDRLSQTVNGVTTYYALDQAAPLTQVLSDGTNDYLYGLDRIAQVNGSVTEYFLTDALGSVRQLADNTGAVTLAKSYQPFGDALTTTGNGASIYGFTGEQQSQGLVYLRSRYYSSAQGRFLTRDIWDGDYKQPMSLNRWLYSYSNPIIYTDPKGQEAYYYNRNAAAAYAIKWAERYNYREYGVPFRAGVGDCTNFVSQALKAGGLPDTDSWYFHRWGPYPTCGHPELGLLTDDCGKAWPETGKLFEDLTLVRHFTYSKFDGAEWPSGVIPHSPNLLPSPRIEKVRAGDVAFYKQDENADFNHAAFITGWGQVTDNGVVETEIFAQAPRIVDHAGSVAGSHTINDTSYSHPVRYLFVVHIPDVVYTSPSILKSVLASCP